MVKAVINSDKVLCGKCEALLFKWVKLSKRRFGYTDKGDNEVSDLINGRIEIKCKHKANGKTCNEINEILL